MGQRSKAGGAESLGVEIPRLEVPDLVFQSLTQVDFGVLVMKEHSASKKIAGGAEEMQALWAKESEAAEIFREYTAKMSRALQLMHMSMTNRLQAISETALRKSMRLEANSEKQL